MITLQQIDRSNYMECIFLKVRAGQETFVASNAQSLVEAQFEEGLYTKAIYADETMIGFVLYDYDPEIPGWSMSRFMIGEQYQGQGFGKKAVLEFIKYMKEEMKIQELYISVGQENKVAYELYKTLGFIESKPIEYEVNGIIYHEIQMKLAL